MSKDWLIETRRSYGRKRQGGQIFQVGRPERRHGRQVRGRFQAFRQPDHRSQAQGWGVGPVVHLRPDGRQDRPHQVGRSR